MRARADVTRCARLATLAVLLVAAHAAAQDDLQGFRPTGPVTLTADRAEWVQGGEMQYFGHVSMQSDTLQLRGDHMTVRQHDNGQFDAQMDGAPAQLDHAGRPGTRGAASQPVTAQAARIDYDSRSGVVTLSGNARLLRGSDEVTGEQIDYIVAERRIRAAGGEGGQVRIVIQPPSPGASPQPSPGPSPSPAPAATASPPEPTP